MRIVLDANVLFAASITPQGRSASLFALAERGACSLLASPHAITEARRNLEVKYADSVERFERLLRIVAIVSEAPASTVAWARTQGLPPEDAPILAAAAECRSDALVTGDRTHFGHLFGKTVRGVKVLRLADALRMLFDDPAR